MKKKITILAALVLSVFVTASYVGGTYAKYTSQTTSTDTARVAKWGFYGSTTTALDLFDGTYTNVESGDSDNVLAPGTSKKQTISFTYAGTSAPEVSYKIDIELDGTISDALANKLSWSLNDTVIGSFADLKTAVAALSQSSVAAGTTPSIADIKIAWEWPFEVDAAGDASDSELGDNAALGSASTAEVTLTITATQLN